MLKLNRLDGWERLSVVVGVLLALTVAIYAPTDESRFFTNGSDGAKPPWYGIPLSSRNYSPPAPAPAIAEPAPLATPIEDDNSAPKGFTPLDDAHVELSDVEVWSPDLYVDYLDTRITALFMLLAGVLPYIFVYVVRWIAAGFKNVKG